GYERWVLWVGEATPAQLQAMPHVVERVQAAKQYREGRFSVRTQKLAATPTRFHVESMPTSDSILVPRMTLDRASYHPLGMIGAESICSELVSSIPGATVYHFGVLQSRLHNVWMKEVAGRFGANPRYSAGMVYNNFIWPEVNAEQEREISELAQEVLKA